MKDFIAQHNMNPKPFVWTKSTEEILEKVGRAREQLNNLQSNRDTTLDNNRGWTTINLTAIRLYHRNRRDTDDEIDSSQCTKRSEMLLTQSEG